MDSEFVAKAIHRIYLLLIAFSALGAIVTFGMWGWKGALGFAVGALFSYLNFRWLHQVVETMGPDAPPPARKLIFWIGVRYFLFGGGAYGIISLLGITLLAPLSGLLVAAAAVSAEILIEILIYART